MQIQELFSSSGDVSVLTDNTEDSKKILAIVLDGIGFCQNGTMFENNRQMKADFVYQNGTPFTNELSLIPTYHGDYDWAMSKTFFIVFRFHEERVLDGNVQSYNRGIIRYTHFAGSKEVAQHIDYDKRRDDDGYTDDGGVINMDDYILDETMETIHHNEGGDDEIPF